MSSGSRAPRRVVAVDWSGAGADGANRQPGIWVASWTEGVEAGAGSSSGAVDLFGGLSRDEVAAWVAVEARRDPALVVGFDFSFSFPAWFVRRHGGSAAALWKTAAREGERWLAAAAYPFWRTARPAYPGEEPEFRRAELALGRNPSSTFKLVGDGQVGTGSVRGMPMLGRLREAGLAIWPFDAPGLPMAIEIYPTACYPRGMRATAAGRGAFLEGTFFSGEQVAMAERSADAFDAAAALVAMVARRAGFPDLEPARNAVEKLEGRIWTPEEADRP